MSNQAINLNGNENGVILIHGLTGSPYEMKYLATQLNRAGFSVAVPCLAGHSQGISDLKKTTWQDWYKSVQESMEVLKGNCSRIFTAGLCMGAVLALHVARQYPLDVKAVAALSTTFQFDGWGTPWYRFLMPINNYTPAKYFYSYPEREPYGIKNERLRRMVAKGLKDNSIAYDCVPGVSMYELHKLAGVVKQELPELSVPTLIIHSTEDDTASINNANYIEKKIGTTRVRKIFLDNCYHMITMDNQREVVANEVVSFFRETLIQSAQAG
ncbi:MAG: alpha/beta hydrolase fold protein [Firmicutes bacterium]|nr:alpha/beta hydrolase fold protein [Bacillota bacterium]